MGLHGELPGGAQHQTADCKGGVQEWLTQVLKYSATLQ